jgi:diguanylate cyclase (GGDEF)-like protein
VPVLIGVQVTASLLSFAFIAAGPSADGMAPQEQATLGVLWALVAAFTVLGHRFLPFWFIDVSLLSSALLLSLSVTFTPAGVVQILDGVGLIGFGVFAAYQLSLPRLSLFIVVTTVAYSVALVLEPVLAEPFVAVIVMVIFVLNTLHVWHLVNRLRDTAVTDPLTGALNRKGLFQRAPIVRATADRAGKATAVAVIDLDRFKQWNDSYGHAAGDRLLLDLVTAWREELRPSDLIARIGGDEFVLVLPNCDLEQVDTTLERLRGVSGSGWTSGSVMWEPGVNVLTAVDEADQVMYAAKRSRA